MAELYLEPQCPNSSSRDLSFPPFCPPCSPPFNSRHHTGLFLRASAQALPCSTGASKPGKQLPHGEWEGTCPASKHCPWLAAWLLPPQKAFRVNSLCDALRWTKTLPFILSFMSHTIPVESVGKYFGSHFTQGAQRAEETWPKLHNCTK